MLFPLDSHGTLGCARVRYLYGGSMENTRVDVSTGVGGGLAQSLHQPSLDSLKKSGIEECFLNEVIDNHPDRVDIEPKLVRMLRSLFYFFFHAKAIRKIFILNEEKSKYSLGIRFVTCSRYICYRIIMFIYLFPFLGFVE